VWKFGEEIFLVETLPYQALKGPPIDNKFLKKHGPKEKIPEREPPIVPFVPPEVEKISEEGIPFRKITHGKKKEKPWKKYQKKREKEKYE
jgi:putative RNA 2'-phosphotransferase